MATYIKHGVDVQFDVHISIPLLFSINSCYQRGCCEHLGACHWRPQIWIEFLFQPINYVWPWAFEPEGLHLQNVEIMGASKCDVNQLITNSVRMSCHWSLHSDFFQFSLFNKVIGSLSYFAYMTAKLFQLWGLWIKMKKVAAITDKINSLIFSYYVLAMRMFLRGFFKIQSAGKISGQLTRSCEIMSFSFFCPPR